MGRLEEAGPVLDRALRLRPRLAWAWAWRGQALCEAGRHQESLESFEKALATGEQRFALAHVWRGEALWALGRRAEAEAAFRKAFILDGKCSQAKAWMGRLKRLGERKLVAA